MPRVSATPEAMAACANCGTPLRGPYCSHCGQKAAALNPTAHDVTHDLVHEFAHVDGKIVRSTALLLGRPGRLSREYFDGRRAQFISPIRLYLVFSVLYFGLVAVIPPSVTMQITCTDCSPEQRALAEEGLRDAIVNWIPRTMFVLVPLFAALVSVAARGARKNYPLHLYFALHVHAAWFAALSLLLLAGWPGNVALGVVAAGVVVVYCAAYPVVAFRRAYGMPLKGAAWRMGLALAGYIVAVLLAVIGIVVTVVLPVIRSSGVLE
jgi:hypothetical protein